jgi:LysM repeat protein
LNRKKRKTPHWWLAFFTEKWHPLNLMKPTKLVIAVATALILGTSMSFSQETKKKASSENKEIAAIRELVEAQSKQMETLAAQMARLTQLVEALRPAPTPTPAPVSLPAATPSITPEATPAVAVPAAATPAPENPSVHTVTKGETLTSIAKHYKTTVGDLLKVNKIENDRMLQIGQTLVIPTPTPTPPPVDIPPIKKQNP